MKHLYIFKSVDKEGNVIDRQTKMCKAPERTKIYKELLCRLDDSNNVTELIEYYIELPF